MTVVVPTFRTVVTLHKKSGIEADSVQNVWHFIAPAGNPSTPQFGDMMNILKDFYDLLSTDLGGSLSSGVNPIFIEFTKLTAERPPPGIGLGPPIINGAVQWLNPPPTATGYPEEVCTCVTLDGTTALDSEGGVTGPHPAARKRNRKYIGPLNAGTGSAGSPTYEVRPTVTWRSKLAQAVLDILITKALTKGWSLTGFSPTLWQTFPPHNLWVDDAFDTQRRRGEAATTHTVVPTPLAVDAFIDAHAAAGVTLFLDATGNLRRA